MLDINSCFFSLFKLHKITCQFTLPLNINIPQISMSVSVAVLCATTMLHVLTLMAVMTVPVTLDSPEMDSTALVRFLRIQTFTLNFAMISQSSLHQLLCIYEVVPALNHFIIIVMVDSKDPSVPYRLASTSHNYMAHIYVIYQANNYTKSSCTTDDNPYCVFFNNNYLYIVKMFANSHIIHTCVNGAP